MNYIGSKVKSSATYIEGTIEGIKGDKVIVSFEGNGKIECSLESLIISDDIKDVIINEINKTNRKKIKTGVSGELDIRRSPEQFKDPLVITKLHKGDCLGTNGKEIYEALCTNNNFGWDISKANNFGMMQRMYCDKVTKEGYSVWMLTHSSYNNSVAKSEKVVNSIMENSDIVETWNENTNMAEYDMLETRVTFVRNACGQYIFWGLLNNEVVDKQTREVLHKFISDEYK